MCNYNLQLQFFIEVVSGFNGWEIHQKSDISCNTLQIYNSGLLVVKPERLSPAPEIITQNYIVLGYILIKTVRLPEFIVDCGEAWHN